MPRNDDLGTRLNCVTFWWRSGERMMADGGGGFMEAVKARIDATIDACTRCGKCVEACPMVEPAGLDFLPPVR